MPAHIRAYVRRGIRAELRRSAPHIIGVCSLAVGSDQLFATEVLREGGQLHAVVPCKRYETTFAGSESLSRYESLLRRAVLVEFGAFPGPSEEAFFAAGKRVVTLSDRLLAVWDGKPARGRGGTADVVAYATALGKEVVVIWPRGGSR